MEYYNVIVKTDFVFKVYVDFELAHEGIRGQVAKFSLRKGDHHFRVESSNPLIFFEDTLSLEYDRIIQLSFKELIQNVPPLIEDSLWITSQYDYEGSGMLGLIDNISGNWILAPRYQTEQLMNLVESKTQAKFLVVENETLLFLSNSGRALEKKHYHHIDRNIGCGYYLIASLEGNGKCGLIYVGAGYIKEITQQEYDEIIINYSTRNDLVINVRKGNRWGCINNKGEIVLPVEYEEKISFEYEGYAITWNMNKKELHLISSNYITISIPDYCYLIKSKDNRRILHNNLMLFSDNNKSGIFDIKSRKTVVGAKYEYIDLWGHKDASQYIRVKNNGKWGFVNSEGKEVIAPIYDDCTIYHGEYAVVCRNREWWVIDVFGNRVSESICGDSIMTFFSYDKSVREIDYYESLEREESRAGNSPSGSPEHPWDHMYIIKDDISKTVGLINLNNGTVLNSNYSSISYMELGLFIARGTSTPGWRYCIDESCQEVFPGFETCGIQKGKPFMVCRRYAKQYEACEINGKMVYKIAYSKPLDIPNRADYINFDFVIKYGFVFQNGRAIPATEYDDAEDFRGDFAIVSKKYYYSPGSESGFWLKGVINQDGKEVIPIMNLEIERLGGNLFRITKYDGAHIFCWGHKDRCLEVDFDSISELFYDPFHLIDSKSDLLEAHYPDGYNLVDENAIPVFPIHYDSISYIFPHRYAVKKNNKYGVLSDTGETIIPFHYDSLYFKSENWIEVTKDGKMGVINIRGALVVPLRYERFEEEGYNPYIKQIGGVLDGRFVFINRDGTESTFPGIEPPDSWCSIVNGKAIYYKKGGKSFLRVRGRDTITISVDFDDPNSFYLTDSYSGLSAEQMESNPLVKYVKELMLAR